MAASVAQAANGSWYSTNTVVGSAFWTNSYNWSAQPYPAGDQTATFNQGGNSRTNVDVAGLSFGIRTITFDTANAGTYAIGSGAANAQALVFTNNSLVQITSSVNSNQTINAMSMLGIDRNTSAHNYRNDKASVSLVIAGNLTVTNTGTAGTKTLITLGSGPIVFNGNISPNGSNGINLTNNNLGATLFNGSNRFANVWSQNGAMTFAGTNQIANLFQNTDRLLTFSGTNIVERIDFNGHPAFPATVNITADSCLALTNGGSNMLCAYQDTVINGPGFISLLPCTSGNPTGDNLVSPGKTLTINANINGPNGMELWNNPAVCGTYAFNGANSFASLTIGPLCTVSFNTVGNNGSTNSSLGKGAVTVGATGTRLLYTGPGETANRTFTLNAGCIIEQGGTGYLNLSGAPTIGGGAKTITLQGSTAADAELSGVLSNTSGANSVAKSGSAKWRLTANNTYAGTTTVNAGTLSLAGASGTAGASTGYILNGGTLMLENTAAANNTNRLRDASAITLNGGTLFFSNDGGAANFVENAGAVTASAGASTIATVQAASGQTATLRFASLALVAGTVNFTGTGLGESDRNRVFITGQPDGLIGPWATFNGTQYAAYSSTRGVYSATGTVVFADIAARGPSTIASNAASNVRINTAGVSGPIELDSDVTRVASLLQNTATPATINTASKALQTGSISVPAGRAAVTVGVAPADGTLAASTSGGTLLLNNGGSDTLTVNAVIADNGSASKLGKAGSGSVTLAAANTFSGDTSIGAGALVLAHSNALQKSILATAGAVFDSSVPSHAFTLGGLGSALSVDLSDNASTPNPVALAVGNNNANATFSGLLSGNGSLTKIGNGVLTLNSANTFVGGLNVRQGTVMVTNNANALGVGPVQNNATLNLNAGAVTYSGLSVALTGAGTNNVILGTGSATTELNGDYSGFTGIWNIGTNNAAGAGRVRMRGLDNASATINVLSNGTLWVDAAGTHNAELVLFGGDTGEPYGQFRIDNGAVWAGPITLAGDITTSNDGLLGSESGVGTITGVISDRNGVARLVRKVGTQTLVLLGDNEYQGQTWVAAGTLRTPSIKSVGAASSPLGAPTTPEAGTIKIGLGATGATLTYFGMGDTTDRIIDIVNTNSTATIDMSGTNLLKFVGGMTNSTPGNRTLGLQGSTLGTGELAVVISDYSPIYSNMMTKVGSGTWVLSGANTFKGGIKFNNASGANCGTLVAAHPTALGSGSLQFVNSLSTVEFAHDGVGEIPPDVYMNVSAFGTLKSGVAAGDSVGINHNIGRLTISAATALVTRADSVLSGDPAITATSLDLFSGGTGTTHLFPTNATFVVLGGAGALSGSGTKTLNLDGTTEGNAIYGGISNGVNTVALTKSNISTWTLCGSNTYTAATAVNGGRLVLSGPDGKIISTSGITMAGNGTLELVNSVDSNNTDRLRDAAAITMNGAKLFFTHAGGAAHYTEALGALTISANSNVVATSQADDTYTSVVAIASLSRTGSGVLDFRGTGLGDVDGRNQVLITAQPAGLIGLWATHNATNFAAYDTTRGVIAADATVFTDIPALGPYDIVSNAAVNARIASLGDDGPISLAGAPTHTLKSLLQDFTTASTVAMTNRTLQISEVMIANGRESLTLGTEENQGLVMAAAAGGGLTLINQAADKVLTLNAGVTNNASASSLGKYGPGKVKLVGRASYTGATLIDEGELEFGGTSLHKLSGVISGAGTLSMSGTNVLHLLGANTYTGPTYVNAGVLRPDQNTAFGPANAGTVTIASGATLDLACDSAVGGTRGAGGLVMQGKPFIVGGHGVDGAGAITCNGGQNQENAINNVSLTANTTFGGNKRWDFRNFGTFNMNDNTLFKTGINEICFISSTVNPGAGHFVVNQGLLRFETTSVFNGSDANTVTVNNNAIFELYKLAPAAPTYSLILNERSIFRGSCDANNYNTNINVWAGTITLNAPAFLNGNTAPCSWTVTGSIGGTGTLIRAGNNGAILWLMGNNTYSGGTEITNGVLFARTADALPGYNAPGKVKVFGVNGSALLLQSGDGTSGWTSEQIMDLHDNALFVTNTAVLGIDTRLASVDFTRNLTQPLTLTKSGNNTLTLSGTTSFNGPMNLNQGDVVMNGAGNHRVGNVTISNANVLVSNASQMHVYATNTIIGNSSVEFGRMTLAGNAAWGTVLPIVNTATPLTTIGNSGRGVLILQDNAMITNRFIVGANNLSHGAVYQRDNTTFHNWGGQSTDSRIGQSGYGYYELSSGTMTNNGFFQLGVGLTGVGILHQSGGFFRQASKYNGQLGLSRGGTGVVYVTGGKFDSFIGVNVGEDSENSAWRGFAEFTVDGAGDATVAGNLQLANRTNMFATVNLNGGTLTANQFAKGTRGVGSTALLNFDGGAFRARAAGSLFGTGPSTLDNVHVYAGGATIDSTNLSVTANANLLSPPGNGVSSITITPRGGYIGPPMVTIAGGGGTGATAIVDFDSFNGTVSGVTITSRGYGYTSLPTVTLSGGGTNLQTAVTGVTLSPNTSGGLTKLGAGTLTLTGTNTYGGVTTLAAGTLKLNNALALPSGSSLTFSGGTLDLNGMTITNVVNTSGALSGAITNGTLRTVLSPAGEYLVGTQTYGMATRSGGALQAYYIADVAADGSSDLLAVQGDINLSNYALQLVDLSALNRSKVYTILSCTGTRTGAFASTNITDSRWKVLYQSDGSVKLAFVDGTLIKIR